MVFKGNLTIDPRGLIYESYRITGITEAECRSIFLDWALGTPQGADMRADLQTLLGEYSSNAPDHPMTKVLHEGLIENTGPRKRRGGAMGRR